MILQPSELEHQVTLSESSEKIRKALQHKLFIMRMLTKFIVMVGQDG